ncbi:transcriptional regulator [Dictyobacter alpinus]|uniref:Transcriptional regulator n=1 Tax=Dictyobacter alpinus TaxID=2014873 RepID=A0A402BCE2_9CHLR|nr:YafY family protein [Dictyobacter alpinus]GCE29053.1 transcriptional regulator [Dictyobacter alpinus]
MRYMPTSRVLIILELLQAKPAISGPELAARLEIDVRTVRRYITMLQDIGIPVETITGKYGGYRLRPGFKLPPLMFTNDEVLVLIVGLLIARKVGVKTMTSTVEGVIAKIERILPDALRQRVQAIKETLVVGIATPDVLVERLVVETMSLAAQQGRQVWLRYQAEDEKETERVIDPYKVVYHDGWWYALGYCHLRSNLRVFRLDRVQQLELQEMHFNRPADFHNLEYMLQPFAATPEMWHVEVLLFIPLEEAHRAIPLTLTNYTLEHHSQGTLLHAFVESLDWMARFLVGLGCSFNIYQPTELRITLKEIAEEMLHLAQATPTDKMSTDPGNRT